MREQQAKFAEAAQEPDLDTAQSNFKDVAKALSGSLFRDNDEAAELCTYAEFMATDLHRREVTLALKSGRRRANTENELRKVRASFEKLLDGPDAKHTPEGSSLHAITRRWIINIDASFFDRFYRNSNDPRLGKRFRDDARKMRDHAFEVLDAMERLHAEDTTANGQLIVEQVRQEVERLFERR